MNYGRNDNWTVLEVFLEIKEGDWTVTQIMAIRRLPETDRNKFAGDKDTPADGSKRRLLLWAMCNAVLAFYLTSIENFGVVPKKDSRIDSAAGISTTHAQLAGAMDSSIVKGYAHDITCTLEKLNTIDLGISADVTSNQITMHAKELCFISASFVDLTEVVQSDTLLNQKIISAEEARVKTGY
eukprot:scaffold7969_cov56-Attheya_sp.AAC.8